MHDKVIAVRVDEKTLKKLDKLAKVMDRSRSYIVREAVKEYLRRKQ